MDLKYLARLFTVVLLLGSCTPPVAQPDSLPHSGPESAASPSPRAPSERPSLAVTARVMNGRSWYLVPDALVDITPIAGVLVAFDSDPSSTGAFARLRPGDRQAQLVAATGPNQRTASFDLHGLAPGAFTGTGLDFMLRNADITDVLLTGTWGSACVFYTLIQSREFGFRNDCRFGSFQISHRCSQG